MIYQLNHYEALGIAQTANEAEIRAAYKNLALKFHPVMRVLQLPL